MRVVIDANVWISAHAARGLCEALVELCLANDRIVTTEAILADVRDKLIRKIRLPAGQADEVVAFLRHQAEVVNYADDFVILCPPGKGAGAMADMRQLMSRLGLTVNEKKTRLVKLPEELVALIS